ncbi:ferrous iron transport protein B [Campylobacter volucris]|uniref:Ferrous iron transport protein B n=1 Tax=Campylobacter volucris TaxID=1031542 RepID=A0AAE5YID0_9BACT|nr:ferrous iron transport protein B [Campylobacter volucris]AJC93626.1 ferrous iron transport protein B [Campylobacter volucris LMG 24379]KAB0577736.1 ferrous iron transport protein B [Campylobacter volucris]QBL13986.1 ferrous iron transport protein B [Campylobacter volucris]QEL07839.1 ferrous iron transport protein B [Campylobacter volucris]TXK70813.1 ferrous iron transport protein B [Campylobacter volucris]
MKEIIVALVGQPNVGKSLLINAICKANMKVGNFSGVTVEKAQASINFKDYKILFIDLPGTYALDGYSEEEKITKNFLQNEKYDLVVNVVDSTNLERNLILSTSLLEEKIKTIIALNMQDEAKNEGFNIDFKKLSSLLNTPCIGVCAKTKENLNELLSLIISTYESKIQAFERIYTKVIEEELEKISIFLKQNNITQENLTHKELALCLLKNKTFIKTNPSLQTIIIQSLEKIYSIYNHNNIENIFKEESINFANEICKKVLSKNSSKTNHTKTIDAILINKYLGIPIFLFLMWLLFQLTFTLGQIPMDYIEAFFGLLADTTKEYIGNEFIASALADGVIAGVGAVVTFLPNIIILFFGIALLETTGYMARVAFLLDGILYKFGLHGKSFIPLITGFGCSVPAFMATRTLKNKKDRLLTLFIVNFMSCGARLPVYVLFVGVFFPSELAGNYLFGIYILGAFLGLIAAKILRISVFKGQDEPFVMEMPKYRMPNWHLVWFMIYNKAKMYLKKAGSFILLASLVIWFASNFPAQKIINEDENIQKELQIKNSYLGQFGQFIEPVFAPLDFDWKLSVSLVSGLAAKEVMISTMGILYSLGEEVDETSANLKQMIKQNIPFSTAVAFILFVMVYNPCFAATIVFAKEAGGKKYAFYLFIFTCLSAYLIAFIGINIIKLMS